MINRKFFSPGKGIGLYVSPQGMTAVECSRDVPRRIGWRETLSLEDVTDDSLPPVEQLKTCFARLRRRIGQDYTPVGIALADPWVHQVVMGFESLPRRQQEREALIQWRLARDWQRDAERYAISWQLLGERGGQAQIIVQSIERAKLEPLVQQAREQSVMLDGIDAIGNLLFNRLNNIRNGMLLHLQPDYWTVYLTDSEGWPVYRRSKWQPLAQDEAVEPFVAELERMQLSVNHAALENLTLAGPESIPGDLATSLDRRLKVTPQSLGLSNESNMQQAEILAMQAVGNLCH